MSSLPRGTITFLFADIEGSTRLLEQLGERYAEVLADYRRLFRLNFQAYGGHEVDTQGDAFFVAFTQAKDALSAALAFQQSIFRQSWPDGVELRVRMGLHTGEPLLAETGYVGMDVNRAARICASGHGGQILLSETTGDLVHSSLPAGVALRNLGAYRLKDLSRPERIFQLIHSDLPADFPPLKSLDAFPNNLPIQLTSFIGREREIAQIKQDLDTSHLLTLTGAGGSGKTRLALQVAADLVRDFTDGVWLVDLSSLTDPSLVPQTIGSALSVTEQSDRPILVRLMDFLQRRQLLLILDNCEHLLEACAECADSLLRRCPQLRILATSREALGIQGERTFETPTMSLPHPTDLPPSERLLEYEALRLFLERAVLIRNDFRMTAANAPAVVRICQYLDGIPLAIELAAAKVKVLSPEEIAAHLDDRFGLLTAGNRTALPRQQTLQATMDWSYNLLSAKEQVLFHRLSVFAGTFTLRGAEAVCSGAGMEASEVLVLLTQLANKSLVVTETLEREARYRLLETVRQYAWGKLLTSGEAENVQRRHYDWYLALAEEADSHLTGPEQVSWLDRLETEHDNLRAALAWSMKDELMAEQGLPLAATLGAFWNRRNHWREAREWLERSLSGSGGAYSSTRAQALLHAGMFAFNTGDASRAKILLEESLNLAKMLGDKQAIAESLRAMGILAIETGDYAHRATLLEEGLGLFREIGYKPGVAATLANLGALMYFRNELNQAVELLEESLVQAREIGHIGVVASALFFLGRVRLRREQYQESRELLEQSAALYTELGDRGHVAWASIYVASTLWRQDNVAGADRLVRCSLAAFEDIADKEGIATAKLGLGALEKKQGNDGLARMLICESLGLYRELGIKWGEGVALRDLGVVARGQGDLESAQSLLKESLALQRQVGEPRAISVTLRCLAGVASARREVHRAARLFGAAGAIDPTPGASLHPFYSTDYEHDVKVVQGALGDKALAAAWAEGRAMTMEEAVEYALGNEHG